MKQTVLFWILAFLVTAGLSVYQRLTGPTYPVAGRYALGGAAQKYTLERTFEGERNQPVLIAVSDPQVLGTLHWRRFKSGDQWTVVPMIYRNDTLRAEMPNQPPAGKLEYFVTIEKGGERVSIPPEKTVVTRFKGFVPRFVLLPHVLLIIVSLVLALRTGLEAFRKEPRYKGLVWWTLGLLILAGMILGPIVQKYAFGAYWTGFPFGYDLTDNKTLIALIGWIAAAVQVYRKPNPRGWVIFAAVLMIIVFFIPHSLLGSELDYSKMPQR